MSFRDGLSFGIVDSHQHFIDVERFEYYWMKGVPDALKRSFGPEGVRKEMARAGVSCSVAVQAHPSQAESFYLVELGTRFPFVRGVVASIDLTDPLIEETLRGYGKERAIRAVRHQRAEDEDAQWFLRPDVLRGFEAVEKSGLCYDFLCRAHQLHAVAKVAARFPRLKIVLEHAGKPPVKSRAIDEWASALDPLQSTPNVCCKLSELITQADWSSWTVADVQPYISHAVRVLGYERVMWGSGWPICLLASSYEQTIAATLASLPEATNRELRLLFRENAVRWYGLNVLEFADGEDRA
jgi:L-fuconolactonase